MTRKSLSLLALACAGAFALPGTASACQYTAWSGGTQTSGASTLIAGSPTDAPAVNRYSGKCASLSTAANNYAIDNSPGAEKKYFVQFYVFTGINGGTAKVFEADNATPAEVLSVVYDATAGTFTFNTSGTDPVVSTIAQNKWYMVRMSWDAQTNDTMDVTVQGAGSSTPIAAVPAQATGVSGTDQIDTAKLGWISGTGTTDGTHTGILTDAFVSQRATAPARLCRGDANNSTSVTAGDRSAITSELSGIAANLAAGQPDCNEDGRVSASDRTCITGLLAIGATCTDNH